MFRKILFKLLRLLVSLLGLKDLETKQSLSSMEIKCVLLAFVKKFMGKVIRDGQCVALFREYTEGYLKLPKLERLGVNGGAEGLYLRYDSDVGPVTRECFERIEYKPGMVPQPGDIVVFRGAPKNRGFGHVGIVTAADEHEIKIFDQDGISAMNGKESGAKITDWDYELVLGWLRQREQAE